MANYVTVLALDKKCERLYRMRLLTLPQAADRLGISTASVRRLADQGAIEAIRPMGPSGHRRIVEESLDTYLESLRSEVACPAPRIERARPVHSDLAATIARAKALSKGGSLTALRDPKSKAL